MIQKPHPTVARLIVAQLSGSAEGPHLSGATVSRERLLDVSYAPPRGFRLPMVCAPTVQKKTASQV